jgi:ABC-type Na+ efflux pump permease subunit
MFKIARVEIGRSKRRYNKRTCIIIIALIAIAVLSASFSALYELKNDYHIYSVASSREISDHAFMIYELEGASAELFLQTGVIDLYLEDAIFLHESEKSFAAAKDLDSFLVQNREQKLYEHYGESAFPVLIKQNSLKREQVLSFAELQDLVKSIERGEGEITAAEELKKTDAVEEMEQAVEAEHAEHAVEAEREWALIPERREYITPGEFSPPNPIGTLLYALLFIIPSYFIMQIFSSSLLEDRLLHRLDMLLVARPRWEVLFGKNLPYFVLALALVIGTVIAFDERLGSLIFIIPLLLFFFSLSAFEAFIARSYREMSFISLIFSLFVALYVFLPAAFSGTVAVSKISPVTLLLAYFENAHFCIQEYLFSSLQFYAMSATLYYLCLNSFEINPQRSIVAKIFELGERVVKKSYHTFFASILAIPFIFMLEFFLILTLFPICNSFILILIPVAATEEFFKGLFISSAFKNGSNIIIAAIFSALGFFLGEKVIVLVNLIEGYDIIFSQLLLLPLLIHLISALVFAMLYKRGFLIAFACSSFVHFIYDFAVVTWLF